MTIGIEGARKLAKEARERTQRGDGLDPWAEDGAIYGFIDDEATRLLVPDDDEDAAETATEILGDALEDVPNLCDAVEEMATRAEAERAYRVAKCSRCNGSGVYTTKNASWWGDDEHECDGCPVLAARETLIAAGGEP